MVVPTRLANRMRRVCGPSGRGIESGKGSLHQGVRPLMLAAHERVEFPRPAASAKCRGRLVPRAARAAGNRRGSPRRGCRPIRMRRMIAAPIAAPSGTHMVSTAPTAVLIAIRLVVACVVAHSDGAVDTASGHFTGVQQGQCQGAHSDRHPFATEVHFGSALLSPLVHSINPNGAPAGSATTATWPP